METYRTTTLVSAPQMMTAFKISLDRLTGDHSKSDRVGLAQRQEGQTAALELLADEFNVLAGGQRRPERERGESRQARTLGEVLGDICGSYGKISGDPEASKISPLCQAKDGSQFKAMRLLAEGFDRLGHAKGKLSTAPAQLAARPQPAASVRSAPAIPAPLATLPTTLTVLEQMPGTDDPVARAEWFRENPKAVRALLRELEKNQPKTHGELVVVKSSEQENTPRIKPMSTPSIEIRPRSRTSEPVCVATAQAVESLRAAEADLRAFVEKTAAESARLAERRQAALELQEQLLELKKRRADLAAYLTTAKATLGTALHRLGELEAYCVGHLGSPLHDHIHEFLQRKVLADLLAPRISGWEKEIAAVDSEILAFEKQHGITSK